PLPSSGTSSPRLPPPRPTDSWMKHFLTFRDFTRDEFEHLFRRTALIKDRFKNYIAYQPLVDRMLAMVFEKSSTRTRVSFEAGVHQPRRSPLAPHLGEAH